MTDDLYTFSRDRDGTFDTFDIRSPEGQVIASLYFWDEPDTDEAKQAEASARTICKQLNRWSIGCLSEPA